MPDLHTGILALQRLEESFEPKINMKMKEKDMDELKRLIQRRDGVRMSIRVLRRLCRKDIEII